MVKMFEMPLMIMNMEGIVGTIGMVTRNGRSGCQGQWGHLERWHEMGAYSGMSRWIYFIVKGKLERILWDNEGCLEAHQKH
jgi:hypothetical protein